MPDGDKKIGGEVGEIRANIDIDSLNRYIERHVPAVRVPVAVKQFKVRLLPCNLIDNVLMPVGRSLDRCVW